LAENAAAYPLKIVGAANTALSRLEQHIQRATALGKSPSKNDAQLLKSIYRALDLLKNNPFAGQNVQREKIPRTLAHLPNLFRMELSQFWRLPYYVVGDEVRIISVVFEISDHPTYDKIFHYKKR
jgi:hypothetical protein